MKLYCNTDSKNVFSICKSSIYRHLQVLLFFHCRQNMGLGGIFFASWKIPCNLHCKELTGKQHLNIQICRMGGIIYSRLSSS